MGITRGGRLALVFGWLAVSSALSQEAVVAPRAAVVPPRALDPAIATIVDSNPQTPAQLAHAVNVLEGLGEIDLARQYLERLLALKDNEDAMAAVARQLGTADLLRLANSEALRPAGQQVADAALAAAAAQARDSRRIDEAVSRLGDPSPGVRRETMARLLAAGGNAVWPLLGCLADPQQADAHGPAHSVLAALGSDAVDPLIAALAADDQRRQVVAIAVLGNLNAREAVPYLLEPMLNPAGSAALRAAAADALQQRYGRLPTADEAVRFLRREVDGYLFGGRPLRAERQGTVVLWEFDTAQRRPAPMETTPDRARVFLAARLAKDLFALAPDDPVARRVYLISTLEAASYRAGLDTPLPRGPDEAFDRAAALGVEAVEDVLVSSIKAGRIPAATAAAQVLGEIGDTSLLSRASATPTPLVAALRHSDRRLRFAALEAVVRLQPVAPFAGSSYLGEALAYFSGSAGRRNAVVAFPNLATATQLATLLAAEGFEAQAVVTGRQLFLAAAESGECELVLISGAIGFPSASELLSRLRADPRTATLLVGLMAEGDELDRLRDLAAGDQRTLVFPRPLEDRALRYWVDRLIAQAGDTLSPPPVRQRQAALALEWFALLSAGGAARLFDPLPHAAAVERALYVSALGPQACRALAGLGTPRSQKALLDLASQSTQPLESRQAAAAAFGESVRRFGLRLTTAEILQQYARYNQSEFEDRPTQELLGLILDAIELPTLPSARAGSR